MYIPADFAEPDVARARALMNDHAFATLVVPSGDGAPEIAHVPFLVDPAPSPFGRLRAHVALGNPIAARLASAPRVVAVFQGPHAYVTPRWYELPEKNVPTWNFTVVHAHGVARMMDDRADVLEALRDLSARYEAGAKRPWTVEGADSDYIERLLGGIVAFSIVIDQLESKAKLSQNRSDADRRGVARGLRERGGADDVAVAEQIEANETRVKK
jgi:transcriptional regulator